MKSNPHKVYGGVVARAAYVVPLPSRQGLGATVRSGQGYSL